MRFDLMGAFLVFRLNVANSRGLGTSDIAQRMTIVVRLWRRILNEQLTSTNSAVIRVTKCTPKHAVEVQLRHAAPVQMPCRAMDMPFRSHKQSSRLKEDLLRWPMELNCRFHLESGQME